MKPNWEEIVPAVTAAAQTTAMAQVVVASLSLQLFTARRLMHKFTAMALFSRLFGSQIINHYDQIPRFASP